ncbi:hypothetical protein Bbelb_275370 [Branchiostoma belcheri]|nr:hypothetical protein Bbelb_275370 [Branchiostoma belcheri]
MIPLAANVCKDVKGVHGDFQDASLKIFHGAPLHLRPCPLTRMCRSPVMHARQHVCCLTDQEVNNPFYTLDGVRKAVLSDFSKDTTSILECKEGIEPVTSQSRLR